MTSGSENGAQNSRISDALLLQRVLSKTEADLQVARLRPKHREPLAYALYFARHFGAEIAQAFRPEFGEENVASGEIESGPAESSKRVDVSFSTRQSGLGFMVSLKSVHFGERGDGSARFTHNLKRNDEELRVEATSLHLRQPYSVLAAVMVLPFEACSDPWNRRGGAPTSSFARWVEKLWTLKGRREPEDPPDRFELVFVALYARNGSELGFYEVGGSVPCPRVGRPASLMSFKEFTSRIRVRYYERNGRDFYFAGEAPRGGPTEEEGQALA